MYKKYNQEEFRIICDKILVDLREVRKKKRKDFVVYISFSNADVRV